jgi:hypothetical protein
MIEAQGRHLIPAELPTSEQPATSGDHIAIAIDEDRDIEAKNSDAFSNLLDLLLAVQPRVCRVRFKLGSRAEMIFKPRWLAACPASFIR